MHGVTKEVTVGELRTELRQFENKSTARAIFMFPADAVIYAVCFLCLAWLPGYPRMKALLTLFTGIHITRFFILGHDAAHGALTASPVLNAFIGRIALLPSFILSAYGRWGIIASTTRSPTSKA